MATASRFAGEGFRVVLSSRSKSNVAAQADQLRAAGFAAEGRVADASDITSIAELIREVEVETGGVDVLHFNAAAMHDGNLETQSVAGFIQDLTTNIGAVYAAIKAVTPRMAAWRRRDPADWRDVCHSAPPGVSDAERRQSRAA
ncbi:SDR family oxidoreductase [Klebsiella variicola subsp. variicola]|nr:SDR family oxidoreductase [Klebsiella variicola subsp. variicola]